MRDTSRREFVRFATQAMVGATTASALAPAVMAHQAKPRIKIGQIGVGHSHAEGKMKAFRNSPDWEVVGVVEPNPELRSEAKQKETYRDLPWITQEQLLNTPGLQAVAVETRVTDLLDVAQVCVAAGKHIHLDKPPGASLDQFQRLLASVDRQGLTLQMGYMYRYNPAIVLLRDLLQKGWLGEVFEIHAVMSKVVGQSKRKRWAQYPGGSMFELGCHLVDLLIGVLGRPSEVTAYNQHSGNFDDTLMDNMLTVCKYPRATATLKSTALEVEGFARRHFVVCGTGGTLHIQPLDEPTVRLALNQPRGSYRQGYQEIKFDKYERYIADVADFAAVVRGEKKSDFDTAHDFAAQETLLKACGINA